MSVTTLLQFIGILAILLILSHGRSSYWRGKFEALENERPDDGGGWRSEALFLRRVVNGEAAEAALDDCEEHY